MSNTPTTTRFKRALGILTALAVILTILPLSGLFDHRYADAASSGTGTYTFSGGNGTAEQPYQINTEKDLKDLAKAIDGNADNGQYLTAYYTLTDDITLSGEWTPIGRTSPFNGTFDGAGHKISGLKINITTGGSHRTDTQNFGLFGKIGTSGTVKNLAVEGDVTVATGWYIAIVAGMNDGTIENCSVKGTVKSAFYFGGIAGYSADKSSIKNCYADIKSDGKGSSNFGSVAGYADKNCDLSGTCFVDHGYEAVGMNPSAGDEATLLTKEEVNKGKAAWLLRNSQETADKVYWGQNLSSETEPKLSSSDTDRVFKATFMYSGEEVAVEYANKGKLAKPDVDYDKDGHTAGDKWYKDEKLSPDKEWNFAVDTINEDITLYGGEALVDYTITLDLAGGTLADTTGWTETDGKYTRTFRVDSDDITLPTPTKEDHTFVGWTSIDDTSFSGESKKDVTIPKGSTGSRTYTAVYKDAVGPEITITLDDHNWSGLHEENVDFDTFYNSAKNVTVTATDKTSTKVSLYYCTSETPIKEDTLKSMNGWSPYTSDGIKLTPECKVIIYVKAVDDSGNTTFASTTGIVLDITSPEISGIGENTTYCEGVTATVKDDNLAKITVDGEEKYNVDTNGDATSRSITIENKSGSPKDIKVVATDKAGNTKEFTVKTNGKHISERPFNTRTEYTINPTCTYPGEYTVNKYCDVCGQLISQEKKTAPATGHKWGAKKEISSEICGDTTYEQKCNICGATQIETVGGSHEWEDTPTVDKAPTCKKDGQQSIHCKKCKIQKPDSIEAIPALAHNPGGTPKKEGEKLPTCTEDGGYILVYRCLECTDEVERTYFVVPATGHQWTEWEEIETQKPDTVTQQRKCTVCGIIETKTEDNVHEWEADYRVDKPATCTTDGSESIHCKNCDSTKESRVIKATGHKPGEPVMENVVEATCTAGGKYDEVIYCTVCGTTLKSVSKITEPKGHTWDEENPVITPATCTTDGSEYIKCSVCGETKPGSQKVLTSPGHKWGDWETVDTPDCNNEGLKKRTCDVCGAIEEKGLDPNGHDWGDTPIVDKDPTCTAEGSQSIHCKNCKAVKDDEILPALGHTPKSERENVTNDYTGDIVCERCGEILEKGISLAPVDFASQSGENAPAAKLSSEQIADIESKVLTPDDIEARKSGIEVKIVLTIMDATSTVTDSDKKLTADTIGTTYILGQYLNIDMTKYIGSDAFDITDVSEAVKLTIEVPANLKKDGRTYAIVRIHGNKADILKDEDTVADTITFSTDKFSVYAIVYTDTAAVTSPSEKSPATGSNAPLAMAAVAAAILGLAAVIRKERKAK